MNTNQICITLLIVIWGLNGKQIYFGLKHKLAGEVYHHLGMALFFTIIAIERFTNISLFSSRLDILWLKVTGFILFIPSAFFIFASLFQLKFNRNNLSLGKEDTQDLIDTGVFGIARHPMWLGFSIWSFALLLRFQSIFTLVLFVVAVLCFRIASIKEDDEAINIFGDKYIEYMNRVPMWVILSYKTDN